MAFNGKFNFNRICVLDTETTDKYWNSSAPVQIAAVVCDREGNILDSFNERIKTNHTISPDASAVHGIYARDLIHCRTEKEVLSDFCIWLMNNEIDCILTYNGETFDRPMLNMRCKTLGIPTDYFDKTKFVGIDGYYDCIKDAKTVNYKGLKDALGRKWKLTLVAEHLGINSSGAHDAMVDILMLKDIFWMVDPVIHPSRWATEDKPSSLF